MENEQELPPLHAVAAVLRNKGSFLFGAALLLQIAAILGGGVLPLLHKPGFADMIVVGAAGLVASLTRWWSDYVRGSGEGLFGEVEGENQLGWRIPTKTNLDQYAKADLPAARKLTKKMSDYWSSTEPPGGRRSAECV